MTYKLTEKYDPLKDNSCSVNLPPRLPPRLFFENTVSRYHTSTLELINLQIIIEFGRMETKFGRSSVGLQD